MAYERVNVVAVSAWGRTVGYVAPTGSGAYAFEYDPSWRRGGSDLAPLLMPRRGARRAYAFPDLPESTWQGLPPMIADSLPDAFGNALVNAWMARQGVSRDRVTPLDRLAYLGTRGMGALEFTPDRGQHTSTPTAIDLSELVLAARAAVRGDLRDDDHAGRALQRIIDVGTSAGGQRAKAIINLNPVTQEIRSGHLPPEPGFEPWLLKFDGVGKDNQLGESQMYGRIEHAYALMARAAGITTAHTRLLHENGRAHFMSRRFDRTDDGSKVHMQSLCALGAVDYRLRGTNDYAQLFTVVDSLGLPQDAKTEVLRRVALNVAAMNCDDHTKNFAFLLPEGGSWELSPAYDVTFAYNPAGEWTHQHLMSVNGKFADIRRADLLALADRFAVPRAASAIDQVLDAVDSWSEFATQVGLPTRESNHLASQFRVEELRGRARHN